jgi:hypothetical protein
MGAGVLCAGVFFLVSLPDSGVGAVVLGRAVASGVCAGVVTAVVGSGVGAGGQDWLSSGQEWVLE